MAALPDFSPDPDWLSKRLGGRATLEEAKQAFEKMVDLGYLVKNAEGRWQPETFLLTTEYGIPNGNLKAYHEQMLDLARHSLQHDAVDERFFNSLMINADPQKMPEIRKLLRKAFGEMIPIFGDSGGTETFYLSLQFFRLTKSQDQL